MSSDSRDYFGTVDSRITMDNTLGALLIGTLLGVLLFGMITLQAYTYIMDYPKDKWYLKFMVGFVWLLELGHTIGISYDLYRASVTFYGQPSHLGHFPGFSGGLVVGGAITCIVHVYFSLRLYRLLPTPYNYIGLFCVFLSLFRFIGSAVLTWAAFSEKTFVEYSNKWTWLSTLLLGIGAFVDQVVAGSMIYYLLSKRNKVFQKRLIDRLVTYTVCTGVFPSLCTIMLLITVFVYDYTFVWVGLYVVVAKLYSNSLYASLNSRDPQTDRDNSTMSLDGVPTLGLSHHRSTGPQATAISIEMKTTTMKTSDSRSVQDFNQQKGHYDPEDSA